MTSRHLALMLAGCLAAATAAAQQTLVCPTAPAGRPCDVYHFHVQMYRPDSKQFVELSGVNQFATQAACDRAREMHVAVNTRAVEYLRSIKQQYEADRVGPCHCDMTIDRSAPNHLNEAQRTLQFRAAEEIRLRLRERLLDHRLTSDSEIVRNLWSDPPATPLLGGPRLVAPPRTAPTPILTASEDLRNTHTIDTAKPVVAAMDLPILDVTQSAPPPPPPAELPATDPMTVASAEPATEPATPAPAAPERPAEPVPQTEEVVVPMEAEPEPVPADTPIQSTVPEEDFISAEETAERFISYETQRIQNVLRAASAIADETVKSKIFEAATQRIQLLSNLRLLIEGSGMRSRLAAAARDARQEEERLQLVGQLFGEDVKPHWAPRDAAEVILEFDPEIAAEPERVLRDTTGRVTPDQKKRALYLVLAQTQPTEDQRLWLSSVIEGFLR